MLVSFKAVGKRRRLLDDFRIDWPPAEEGEGGEPLTLRELITRIVRSEVDAFRKRQRDRRFEQVLSSDQIAEAAGRGKIDSGGRDLQQDVDEDGAVTAALEAFEDGIYLVLIDGVEQRDLEAQVYVGKDTQIVFLRLTMLAGA